LNYHIFPRDATYYALKFPRCEWTKAELVALLTRMAADLEASLKRGGRDAFDALFLAMSGHGLKGSVITADHKLLSKTEIHRIFSSQGNELSRAVPRIFLFDCCDGAEDQKNVTKVKTKHKRLPSTADEDIKDEDGMDEVEESKEPKEEQTKESAHVANGSITDWLWKHGELNPDHRLAVLNAANEGFQSKMTADIGSYVIHGFWRRATALLKEKGEIPRIGKIFAEIQNDLGAWKQMPVFEWNNDTENVVFKPRSRLASNGDATKTVSAGDEAGDVQMAEIILESGDVEIVEEEAADGAEAVSAEDA